jgi:hypothetical protein
MHNGTEEEQNCVRWCSSHNYFLLKPREHIRRLDPYTDLKLGLE